jgi:hypothetical protein
MDVLAHAFHVDHWAAEASGLAARELRGQPASRIPHRVFPRCPGAALPIFVEVGLCAIGEKDPPGFLEINSRLVEGGGRAGRAFPWIAARVEAALLLHRDGLAPSTPRFVAGHAKSLPSSERAFQREINSGLMIALMSNLPD